MKILCVKHILFLIWRYLYKLMNPYLDQWTNKSLLPRYLAGVNTQCGLHYVLQQIRRVISPLFWTSEAASVIKHIVELTHKVDNYNRGRCSTEEWSVPARTSLQRHLNHTPPKSYLKCQTINSHRHERLLQKVIICSFVASGSCWQLAFRVVVNPISQQIKESLCLWGLVRPLLV